MIDESLGRFSIRELIVDFLGSLVPGLIFVTTAVAVAAWPAKAILEQALTALGAGQRLDTIYGDVALLADATRVEITVLMLMIAYVAGHLFYRQDPKVPDERSFRRSVKDTTDWVTDRDNCEFPYRHFDRYLRSRNLTHLLPLAGWCHDTRRTKYFLNILKIRLFYEHPDKCGSIAKNEAHVRLMASTWYMSRALQYFALCLAMATCLSALVAQLHFATSAAPSAALYLIPAAPAFVAGALATVTKRLIERFLHYQRVREVMWVLETAYVAYRDSPEKLRDLCPDFELRRAAPSASA